MDIDFMQHLNISWLKVSSWIYTFSISFMSLFLFLCNFTHLEKSLYRDWRIVACDSLQAILE